MALDLSRFLTATVNPATDFHRVRGQPTGESNAIKSAFQSGHGYRQSYPKAQEQARSDPQVVRSGEGCDQGVIMQRGYLKLWRKVEDSGLLQMPETYALFTFLLLRATHSPRKIGTPRGVVSLVSGQFVSGRITLARELCQSERQIRTGLERLQDLGIITIETTSLYSIYTVVNYDNYQDCDQLTTSQTTKHRPSTDQVPTTKQTLNIKETIESSNSTASCDAGDVGVVYSSAFLTFWDMYPNKKNKGAAFKAFKKVKPAEYAVVKTGLIAKKQSPDWTKDNGQFIPHPASWLNARGWEDESIESKSTPYDQNEFLKQIGAIPA